MQIRLPLVTRILYLTCVVALALLVLLSCVFLLSQAVRSSPNHNWTRNFNALVIGSAYGSVFVLSMAFCLKRRLSVRHKLSRIPTSRMAISKGDVPRTVHLAIEEEFLRSCAIIHASVPKVSYREGWGRPGSKFDGLRYRFVILDTMAEIDKAARCIIPSMPPLSPYTSLAKHFKYIKSLLPASDPSPAFHRAAAVLPSTPSARVDLYISAVHKARHSSQELEEIEFLSAMEAADWLLGVLKVYQSLLGAPSSSRGV